jgi:putative membrane protein
MPDGAPDLRILQANERTLLAWLRTGLTLMAFGFVVARLSVWLRIEHPEREEGLLGPWLGIAIVALGTACHVIGAIRFMSARRAIVEGRSIQPGVAGPVGVAIAVSAIGIAAIAYLVAGAS